VNKRTKISGTAALWFLIVATASYFPVAILEGAVLQSLWRWFVEGPTHFAALSLPGAIGISLLVYLLTVKYEDLKTDETVQTIGDAYGRLIKRQLAVSFLILFVFGLALIMHSFQ
jgi:hypothetical protein